MKLSSKKKKILSLMSLSLFVFTGTYNAFVINSESMIEGHDVRFVKRLDEVYGVVQSGRKVAASVNWQKLTKQEVHQIKKVAAASKIRRADESSPASSEVSSPSSAAVQEDLTLSLAEVINQSKWQKGLNNTQFSGSMTTNNGIIEALDVSLPDGEGLSISFSEMSGNVFEYDMNGEIYSGMMYQVDQLSYMITLTNGPLQGTRLRFNAEKSDQQDPYMEFAADVNPQEVASEAPSEEIQQAMQGQDMVPPPGYEEHYQAQEARPEDVYDQSQNPKMVQAMHTEQQPSM